MNLPLAVARGARLPTDPWTPRDWALAQAVKMLNRSRCSGCGQPTWLSHDKDSKWRPHWVKCESCNAIEDLKERPPRGLRHLIDGEDARPQVVQFHTEYVP